jgi:predicted PhzF superfamily epimerase YddE/YHI9
MPEGLAGALGATPRWVGKSAFDYLIEVADASMVRGLKPDFARLGMLPVRGIIVTARSDTPDFDIVSRFFAPAEGVNEDPVTGSAHCSLGPFWRERLGRDRLRAHQASARGGALTVEVRGDRVLLGGTAVTMLRGELVV